MIRWKRDVIYSIALLVFCAFHWYLAEGLVQTVINVPVARPSVYSELILGILALLSVMQLVRAVVKKPCEQMVPIWTPLAAITVITLMAYVMIIKTLGFQLSTFLAMAVLITSYSAGMGKVQFKDKKKAVRQILLCLLLALAVSLSTELIFRTGLGAKLPKGTIF